MCPSWAIPPWSQALLIKKKTFKPSLTKKEWKNTQNTKKIEVNIRKNIIIIITMSKKVKREEEEKFIISF